MKKPSAFLKTIALIGIITGIIGLVIAFKIPGNVAFVPLALSVFIAAIVILIARNKQYKCYGGYIGLFISTIGIVVVLYQQSKAPEVAVDEQQIEQLEETNEEITESEELDNALDELDLDEELE